MKVYSRCRFEDIVDTFLGYFPNLETFERLRIIRVTDKGAYADAIVWSSSNKTCPVGRKGKDQIAVARFDSGISQCADNEG